MSKGLTAMLLPFLKADWAGCADLALTKDEIEAYQKNLSESEQGLRLPQNILKADRNRDGQVTLSEYLRWHPETRAYAKPVVKYLNSKPGQSLLKTLKDNSGTAAAILKGFAPLIESAIYFVGASSKLVKKNLEAYAADQAIKTADFSDPEAPVCVKGGAYEKLLAYGVKEEIAEQLINFWHKPEHVPQLDFLLEFLSVEELNTFLELCVWQNDFQGYLDVLTPSGMEVLRELKKCEKESGVALPIKDWIMDSQVDFLNMVDKAESLEAVYSNKISAFYNILNNKNLREAALKTEDLVILVSAAKSIPEMHRGHYIKLLSSTYMSARKNNPELKANDFLDLVNSIKPFSHQDQAELLEGLVSMPKLFSSKNVFTSIKNGKFKKLLSSFHNYSISPKLVPKILAYSLPSYPEDFENPIERLSLSAEKLMQLFPSIPEEYLPNVFRNAIIFGGDSSSMREYFDTFEKYFPDSIARQNVAEKIAYSDLPSFIYFVGKNRENIESIISDFKPSDDEIQKGLLKRAIYLQENHGVHRFSRYSIKVVNDLMKRRNQGEGIFYLFSAYADHNNAFNGIGDAINLLHELGLEVPHFEINLDDEPIESLIEENKKSLEIGAIYAGHSDGIRVFFGGSAEKSSFGSEDFLIFESDKARFRNFTTIFWGCKSADGEESLAFRLAKAVPGMMTQGHRCNASGYIEATKAKIPNLKTKCVGADWEDARQYNFSNL